MSRYLLLLVFSWFCTLPSWGQDSAVAQVGAGPSVTVLAYADEIPSYAGGLEALHRYLALKTEFPAEARRLGLSGTVTVQFVVDEQGRPLDPYVAKSSNPVFDAEAIRLVRLMPWWNPGRQGGQPVRVRYTLPIQFTFRR